jgi:hypothetical protein
VPAGVPAAAGAAMTAPRAHRRQGDCPGPDRTGNRRERRRGRHLSRLRLMERSRDSTRPPRWRQTGRCRAAAQARVAPSPQPAHGADTTVAGAWSGEDARDWPCPEPAADGTAVVGTRSGQGSARSPPIVCRLRGPEPSMRPGTAPPRRRTIRS